VGGVGEKVECSQTVVLTTGSKKEGNKQQKAKLLKCAQSQAEAHV